MLEVLAIGAYAGYFAEYSRNCYINFTRDSRYKIKQVDGLDYAEGTIKMTQYVGLDGANFDSASVGFRTITLTISIEQNAPSARHTIYDVFQQKSHIILYFASGSDRYCHIDGYVRNCTIGLFDKKQMAQVVVDCPSAYLFAGGFIPHTADAPSIGGMTYNDTDEAMYLQPTTDDHWSTGEGTQPIEYLIQNTGEVPVGVYMPVTIIKDGITEIQIYCRSVRTNKTKVMRFRGSFAKYDVIDISTRPTLKFIRIYPNLGTSSYNGMGFLLPSSDWILLEKGDNYIHVTTNGADNSAFYDATANGLYGGI